MQESWFKDGKVYESRKAIRNELRKTISVPAFLSDELISHFRFKLIQYLPEPVITLVQYLVLDEPVENADGSVTRDWIVKDLFTEPLTKAELEAAHIAGILKTASESKKEQLNSECEAMIVSGFTSNALGTAHRYQSDITDQMNLIGAEATGKDMDFKSGTENPDGSITWEWKPHTAVQLKQVLDDGSDYKHQLLYNLAVKKYMLDSATSLEQINSIS